MAEKKIHFKKFQGAGNDFIMIDNRDGHFDDFRENQDFISWLCDRRFGIGADGVLELRDMAGYDFEMVYTREEGKVTPFLCGNGSRCMVAFAHAIGVPSKGDKYNFMARDGAHVGWFDDTTQEAYVKIKDVEDIKKYDDDNFYIHVGNERHVKFVDNIWDIDVIEEGRNICYSNRYAHIEGGCAVMFVQVEPDQNLSARSFERIIDYKPLACGTGAIASSLVNEFRKSWTGPKQECKTKVNYKGGEVWAMFDVPERGRFQNVYLIGPAKKSFEGVIEASAFPAGYKYMFNKM